jgi:hypothetical protein
MTKDEIDRALEAWKVTVEVQQHFNDLEMRVRNYALTLLLAVVAGAGLALREHEQVDLFSWSMPLSSLVLLAGLLAWLAFYLMDELWYHRLLVGAVKNGLEIEESLTPYVLGIGLTRAIGEASPLTVGKYQMHSKHKIRLFYGIIAAILLAGAVVVLAGAPEPTQTQPSPSSATQTTS